MKPLSSIFSIFLCLFLTTGCNAKAYVDETTEITPEDYIIDDFSVIEVPANCPAYRDLQIDQKFGYCIYYDDASISMNAGLDGLFHLDYELQPIYEWGNWLSIRKNAPTYFDFSSYAGVKILLRSLTPENVVLRITLVDIDPNSLPYSSDEMWWYSLDGRLVDEQWQVVTCPFKEFFLSDGFGARQNDGRFDPSHISAYEISVISKPGGNTTGWLELDSLAAYK